MNASRVAGRPHNGVVGRYSHVARDGDLKATAEAVTLMPAMTGLSMTSIERKAYSHLWNHSLGISPRPQVGQVQTGAEAAALAGQEDHPYLGVLSNLPGGREHVLGPVPALGV
jgi:hypothetical protein